ncbi:MAG: DUF480 domain-containing protein [Acidobacteria bacterium]|nr:DUF480 domain-containing protein [Acidobacteriota bacterium]
MVLDPIQTRLLGCLIEKEIVTPENYPLSLNALVNACNQKSSRDPVLELTEDEVRQALHALEDENLVSTLHDSRVPKYEHRIRTVLNLRRDETAVLCLLMLRGPQTPGELRGRAERMYAFDDIAAVQATLERLASREAAAEANGSGASIATGPLTLLLPRQPGSREARYAHLLSGAPDLSTATGYAAPPSTTSVAGERMTHLESEVARLVATVEALQERLARLEQS